MDSVGFDGEGEYWSSTSYGNNYKPPKRLRDACGELDHVSVPRKLRSGEISWMEPTDLIGFRTMSYQTIKKQRRETVTPPLPISKKRYMLNCAEKLRKNGAKKSKLNMRQGRITKDEEEVAGTLNALADMFYDANKANQSVLNTEPLEMKSSAELETEDARIRTVQEESRRITSTVTIEAVSHSSVLNSMHQEVDFQCRGDAQQPELPSSNQLVALSGNQPESMGHMSRVSTTIDTVPSVKQAITPEQVTVPTTQYKKHYYPMDEKKKGIYVSASLPAKVPMNFETKGSGLCLPAWFANTPSQPCVIEESTITENHAKAPLESRNSWKRCSAHVYISRLIKILQLSERKKEGSTDVITPQNKMMGVTGSRLTGEESFNGITHFVAEEESTNVQNVILSNGKFLHDQQLASETSAISSSTNQCYNFLSLHTGVSNITSSEIISRTRDFPDAPTQFQSAKLQNHAFMRSSMPQSGYSSTFHSHNSMLTARQAQLPQYLSSTSNLPTHYNNRVGSLHLPDWRNGGDSLSLQNYACAIFPHLHPVLSSRHQQFSPPEQMFTSMNTSASSSSLPLSNMKIGHQHQLPLQTERNGVPLYHENIRQLQLPSNEHFRK